MKFVYQLENDGPNELTARRRRTCPWGRQRAESRGTWRWGNRRGRSRRWWVASSRSSAAPQSPRGRPTSPRLLRRCDFRPESDRGWRFLRVRASPGGAERPRRGASAAPRVRGSRSGRRNFLSTFGLHERSLRSRSVVAVKAIYSFNSIQSTIMIEQLFHLIDYCNQPFHSINYLTQSINYFNKSTIQTTQPTIRFNQ